MLDLPQLYTKPSAKVLLETLALLTSAPPSWEINETAESNTDTVGARGRRPQVNPEGVTRYLTSIVSSSLRWIEDEETKEAIWEQASLRLSERAGRTAMGAISRQFRIPSTTGHFELSLHEPALTGDDLGLKTWAASYLLAKRLHTFDFPKLNPSYRPQVLELGAGTGLVGLAMAALGADVVLTDLPSIFPNLARNVRDNANLVRENGGSTRSGILDWTTPNSCQIFPDGCSSTVSESAVLLEGKFPVIVAADSLYSPEHPRWLVETIATWLSKDDDARVVVEFPLRDAYLPEIQDFRERMIHIGLHVLEEGEEKGFDDWGRTGTSGEGDVTALVTCWWSYWARRPAK